MKKQIVLILSFFLLLFSVQAFADDFVAKSIRFDGLQRITQNTAMSYLPIRPGDTVNTSTSDEIIRDLYKTGFFDDVSLSQEGSVLVIHVTERPIIRKLVLSGNKVVNSKELVAVLRKMSVAEGYEYNVSTLQTIKTALLNEYYSHGKYNARVTINVVPDPQNSVTVYIQISEGLTATIQQIHIIGNHVYSERKLVDQFQLSTPGWFSFYTHDDEYSSEKLEADLDTLNSYYMNHGYLKFKIDHVQVSLSPDRNHVYIDVAITEGPQYTFSGYSLDGQLILPEAQLQKLITVKKGQVFSKQAVITSETAIGDALGAKGYAKAQVTTSSNIDEEAKTIFVIFHVVPGPLVYVHNISFSGASGTNDFAFRRQIKMMEGGLISTTAIRESKQDIQQLPFVTSVDVTTKPVPGQDNEEDVDYNITTVPAGEVKAGLGYSDVDGLLVNAGINQNNIFGTGNAFGFNVSYSASLLSANISYFNPYYTTWGVGRGFNLYASHYDASGNNNQIADYQLNSYGGSVNYAIPLTQYQSLMLSFGLDYTYLFTSSSAATIMRNFVNEHGRVFYQIPLSLGWMFNDLDRAIFPTKGWYQSANLVVSAPVTSNESLEYYKVTYGFDFYQPIYGSFVGKLKADVGYGNGYGSYSQLPFFRNFYVGGIGSVRGYTANTIGPQDNNRDAIGGNAMFDASVNLIFPNPVSRSLRTSVFLDAGNVYNTNVPSKDQVTGNGPVRLATGLEFDWLSPLGLLNFSLADAINPTKSDNTSIFQFNIGTTF